MYRLKLLTQKQRHSSKDVQSLALIDQSESYHVIELLMELVAIGLQELQESTLRVTTTTGEQFFLLFELHLCCDWKFLALLMGINAANSAFFCLVCTCPKECNADFAGPIDDDHRRTDESPGGQSCKNCENRQKCCDGTHGLKEGRRYLLQGVIPRHRIWLDGVHMYLRLSDQIEGHIQTKAKDAGLADALTQAIKDQAQVTYQYWRSSKKKDKLCWPSLNVNARRRIFVEMKDLSPFLPSAHRANTRQLMSEFIVVMDYVMCPYPTHRTCDHVVRDLDSFRTAVTSFSKIAPVPYLAFVCLMNLELLSLTLAHPPPIEDTWKLVLGEDACTPYLHGLDAHVPEQIERSPFNSIAQFQLQGQEAKHQDQTKVGKCCTDYHSHRPGEIIAHEHKEMYVQGREISDLVRPTRGPQRISLNVLRDI